MITVLGTNLIIPPACRCWPPPWPSTVFPRPRPLLRPPFVVLCCHVYRCCNQRAIEEAITPLPPLSSSSMATSILLCRLATFVTIAIKNTIEEQSRSDRGGLRRRVFILLICGDEDSSPCPAILSLSGGESFSSYFARRTLVLLVLLCYRYPRLRKSVILDLRMRDLLLLVHCDQRGKEEDNPYPSSNVFLHRHALL